VPAEPRGDRITSLQISSAAFFGSGDAALSGAGKVHSARFVAVTLKSERFASYRISIEGHTDDSPISTAQFSVQLGTVDRNARGRRRALLSRAGYSGAEAHRRWLCRHVSPSRPTAAPMETVIPENQAKKPACRDQALKKIDIAER